MAGSSLLALIDDIASVLDDVALMTKVAAKKTAGVLGDDLALNAEQVAGVRAERELPVVWAVGKGSMRNKLILVPIALFMSAVIPLAVTPLLMVGGAFYASKALKSSHTNFSTAGTTANPNMQKSLEPSATRTWTWWLWRGKKSGVQFVRTSSCPLKSSSLHWAPFRQRNSPPRWP